MVKRILPHPDKTVFSPAEACGYMGVCWNTLKTLIRNGDISCRRIGRRYLITRAAIDEYLNEEKTREQAFLKSIIE